MKYCFCSPSLESKFIIGSGRIGYSMHMASLSDRPNSQDFMRTEVHQGSVFAEVPVACKSCPCGYIFISRKLLHAKRAERSPPITENKSEAKRRRTERVKREKINSAVSKDLENRKRSRSNSHSDHSRRGRGRPKSASAKKHEEEKEKQEKEVDMYANLSDEKAFVFSVALAEINRKIINQRLIL
ncbi:UPF0547 protein C16orf87 homolog isoform X1 [Zonotrichia leucophrys gambelii]|uniref:UPF0547 protein C16orf87 homolog isoform X1 n=2 Tax=Zonotrichia leucophrys gambelii TaxID=257770 RepID=UPI00313FFCFB